MSKKVGDEGLGIVWMKVFSLIKLITGDVEVSSKGTLQHQISNLAKVAFSGKYIDLTGTPSTFVKSGSGAKGGLVPAPSTTAGTSKYLNEDGTWKTPPNSTYTPAAAVPKANGTAAVGSSVKYAREDHVHPAQTTVSGNAGSATKFATARSVKADRNNYGTCSTAAATAAKVVACTGFTLVTGAEITVKFTVTNTADNPTLNVNSTGAKAIYYRGNAINKGYLAANRTYTFRYNGTQYELVGDVDTNSTYVAATAAPKAAGTANVGESTKYAREDHVHPSQTSVTGNAGTATKLANARTVDGVNFDGSAAITHYGTCSTAAGTAAKVVAITGFTLVTGAKIAVKFTVTNTAASPTLNVNGTGAKPIYYRGAAITAGYLAAKRVYEFVYDGTNYELIGDIDTNTTYNNMTAASTSAAGKSGLVPAPGAGAANRYLRSDGTWAVPPDNNTTYADMKGATADAAGTHGLVPAPAKGNQSKYLRGDGTWQTPPNTTYSNMSAATASAAGKAGLVPAPGAGKQNGYLRGDGTWAIPTNNLLATVAGTPLDAVQGKALDDKIGEINSNLIKSVLLTIQLQTKSSAQVPLGHYNYTPITDCSNYPRGKTIIGTTIESITNSEQVTDVGIGALRDNYVYICTFREATYTVMVRVYYLEG